MAGRSQDAKLLQMDLKIIVIGSSGSGKTSFVNKWTCNKFSEEYKATIVSEFSCKIIKHKGKIYRIHLWDLARQDRNQMVTNTFARDSHGCILVTDARKPESIEE